MERKKMVTFDWTSFFSSLMAPMRSLMTLIKAASGHSGQSGELIGISPGKGKRVNECLDGNGNESRLVACVLNKKNEKEFIWGAKRLTSDATGRGRAKDGWRRNGRLDECGALLAGHRIAGTIPHRSERFYRHLYSAAIAFLCVSLTLWCKRFAIISWSSCLSPDIMGSLKKELFLFISISILISIYDGTCSCLFLPTNLSSHIWRGINRFSSPK